MSTAINARNNVICAGCIVFRLNESGNIEFLLVKHVKDKNDRWGAPKGHANLNESVEETAIRETFEETGVVSRLLHELSPVITANKSEVKTVHFFLAKQLNPQCRIKFDSEEISEAKWFAIEDLPELYYYQRNVIVEAKNIIQKYME